MSLLDTTFDTARTLAHRVRRAGRRLTATLGRPRATLVYHRDYQSAGDYLVDPLRAQKILDYLLREGRISARHVIRPASVTIQDLALVHYPDYLVSLDDREVLERIFGEHTGRVDADTLIAQQRRMVAGTILAARSALDPATAGRPAINLGGGQHHAHRERGGGFCIFNDVAIAIAKLRGDGFLGRILVVDLDLHHGDGTRRIFGEDTTVYTFSIHATDWEEGPAVACTDVALGPAIGDRAYLDALDQHLPAVFREARPDLVFYVAGVDVAADDRLGSWRLTPEAILRRDRAVLEQVGERPLVWVLAGGYGPDAWRYTARSLAWLVSGEDRPIASSGERNLRHFRRIASQFEPGELSWESSDELDLSLTDLLADLDPGAGPRKLLNFYSRYGIEAALERYGVLGHIRELGYGATRVEFELDHPTGQMVRLYSNDGRRDLLIELVLKESTDLPPFRLLSIEWLLLQDPRAEPRPDRPLLPGQDHPGLGCLRRIVGMLVMSCERLGFDGLLFSPSHFHTAAVARGILFFVDPEVEARFLAIEDALAGRSLDQGTQLVHDGAIRDRATGEPVHWQAAAMVIPVSETLRKLIEGPAYEEAVRAAARDFDYVVASNAG